MSGVSDGGAKKMTEVERLELEFYKNGSAESVLKRFVFSEKEEKLVRDAMRTANMPNPRMVLIRQANALLKEIAKTRQPIESTEKTNLSAEAMMQMQMSNFKQVDVKKDGKRIPLFYIPKTKLGRIIFFGMIAFITFLQFKAMDNATNIVDKSTQSSQNIAEERMKLLSGME